uniref:Uncharacterized protein n=1 Tax=Timspurckia oligopyrenoides TaxID=708627 RepID=A0A7S1ETB8_9RHOD
MHAERNCAFRIDLQYHPLIRLALAPIESTHRYCPSSESILPLLHLHIHGMPSHPSLPSRSNSPPSMEHWYPALGGWLPSQSPGLRVDSTVGVGSDGIARSSRYTHGARPHSPVQGSLR